MNKKGQLQLLLNPKTLIYIIGGATIGYIIGQELSLAIIGKPTGRKITEEHRKKLLEGYRRYMKKIK